MSKTSKREKLRRRMVADTVNRGNNHRVTIQKASVLTYPELWMEVFIAGDKTEERAFAQMLVKGSCQRAESPEKADLVVFTGGEDVNPALYGEERHPNTFINSKRDEADIELYKFCVENGVPMFGVCRGAQFLHVMNGGKLYQHVNNHNGDHTIYDIKAKKQIHNVSSVHHQMCISNVTGGMEILADNSQATERWKNPTDKVEGYQMDVEAYFYRDTCCFGVQGHPEYAGYNAFAQWTLEKLQELVVNNPDIELIGRVRRMKPDLLGLRTEARKKKFAEKGVIVN